MSELSYMEKLLDGVEVEWKDLAALTKDRFWIMPATPKFDENEKIPYIRPLAKVITQARN